MFTTASTDATWSVKEKLVPADGFDGDAFGRWVAAGDYAAVVGAPEADVGTGIGLDNIHMFLLQWALIERVCRKRILLRSANRSNGNAERRAKCPINVSRSESAVCCGRGGRGRVRVQCVCGWQLHSSGRSWGQRTGCPVRCALLIFSEAACRVILSLLET